jgi:type IV secretory pathway VirB3-like protein
MYVCMHARMYIYYLYYIYYYVVYMYAHKYINMLLAPAKKIKRSDASVWGANSVERSSRVA